MLGAQAPILFSMLFSSASFILCFLPILFVLWQKLSLDRPQPQKRLLLLFLLASCLFYAFWGPFFLLLLLFMSWTNFKLALLLECSGNKTALLAFIPLLKKRKLIFLSALIFNLSPLIWYKYSAFIFVNLGLLFNSPWSFAPPILPLGISFYTFNQIAYLCDVYRGQTQAGSCLRHLLFSCGFPWIISGPIIRKNELDDQLAALLAIEPEDCARAIALFSIGLAKKLILADTCGFYADNVFNAAQNNWPMTSVECWSGSLFYTFQLYFDFSAYTDMALALGLLLGLQLPENFNSPYKATGIIEFWRRWHITLGAWIRDYIYIPLGGNRNGKLKKYSRLFVSMLLAGIWHGAGWTYILWGALHGCMLIVNHAWRDWRKYSRSAALSPFCNGISILFTFLCVSLCWLIFRASDLATASRMFKSMFNPASGIWEYAPTIFQALVPHHYISGLFPWLLLGSCAFICWFMPTSKTILNHVFNSSGKGQRNLKAYASLFALLAFISIVCSGRQASFLYFQF